MGGLFAILGVSSRPGYVKDMTQPVCVRGKVEMIFQCPRLSAAAFSAAQPVGCLFATSGFTEPFPFAATVTDAYIFFCFL
jgi:hypothetical protein